MKAAVIHTSFVSVEVIKARFRDYMPSVELFNIVDDSLLAEVSRNGSITPAIIRRICMYALEAQGLGANVILNQCSSVGEAVDIARTMLSVPFLKIDEPMADMAVSTGEKIAVVATVGSTVGPSVRLIESMAKKRGREVLVQPYLVEGALDVLIKENDRKKHNRMVLETLEKIQHTSDVIVLAQGSMVVLLPYIKHIRVPVLTSIDSGVRQVKKVLEKLAET